MSSIPKSRQQDSHNDSQCTRCLPLVRELTERALAMAIDASPHAPRAREGESIRSLASILPLARQAVGLPHDSAFEAPPPGIVRWTDGLGHSRPSYGYLASRLLQRAGRPVPDLPPTKAEPESPEAHVHDLWNELLQVPAESEPSIVHPDQASPEPLFTQQPDDSPDEWTYRELVGLHGLMTLARIKADPKLADQAARVALHHVEHTQPDYTTYQPWALYWFIRWQPTATFGEQQLHDVATHLAVEGPPGALVPALLLADALIDLEHEAKHQA
ncbi:hypothetical protein [Mucisphaera sp.]|uniref:hypothetical protein n=1 Tax=Mucisphaera sp. TaxID=2913024 RepID=UPI003D1274FC